MRPSEDLYQLYCGFDISTPVGNNVFSYQQRKNKKIRVPQLIRGTLSDVKTGDDIVFSEIEDGIEKNLKGLENYIHWEKSGKDIFIFDNHNHAICFWVWGLLNQKFECGTKLVHIDQHSDMRQPDTVLDDLNNLKQVFKYTNTVLNVGNFIQPALQLKIFNQVEIIDSSVSFAWPIPDQFVLDIDLDIFAPEMDYIGLELKTDKIRKYIKRAEFITIATSPFFMDQDEAIRVLQKLFD